MSETPFDLVQLVTKKHGVSFSEIQSKRRRPRLVRARDELCYLIRENLPWSFPEIGHFVNRDHSTVFQAVRRHKERIG